MISYVGPSSRSSARECARRPWGFAQAARTSLSAWNGPVLRDLCAVQPGQLCPAVAARLFPDGVAFVMCFLVASDERFVVRRRVKAIRPRPLSQN